jgi:hypothetical protein
MANNIKKFGYAEEDVFTLSGDYIGFYNIDKNIPYAGKYTQDVKLGNVSSVQNSVITSDLFFNRLQTQNFTQTYSLSDIVFQPNEFINSNSIDNKLKKLFINYLDSYRACFMASSELPYNFTGLAKVSATNVGYQFVWTDSSTGTLVSPLSVLNSLITRDSKIVYATNPYSDNNTFILANSGSLMVYKVYQPDSTFTFNFSSVYVETNTSDYGSLAFNNIASLSLYGNNLYVCDSGARTIYYYDITSVLQEDRALGYKFNLVDSINSDQGTFITPTLVSSSETTVYVYDFTTQTVLFYDTNFNLFNTYKNTSLFGSSEPVCLAYYKIYDELFVLTQDFTIAILNRNGGVRFIKLQTDGLSFGEVARKLIFSNTNSDVFYVLSNKNLYKAFVSNPSRFIGNYSFISGVTGTDTNLQADTLLYDIDILETNENTDDILLYGFDQLLNYNEVLVYNSIVK